MGLHQEEVLRQKLYLQSQDSVLLKSEGGDGILAWDDIQHFVVVPNYKEVSCQPKIKI